jgi:hypothetical protein
MTLAPLARLRPDGSWRQRGEVLSCTAPRSMSIGFTPVAIAGSEPSEPPAAALLAGMPFIELEFGRGVRLRISGAPLIRTWRRR